VGKGKKNLGFTLYRPDEERLSVHLNGQYVTSANHDEHGWEGIDKLETTVNRIAEILGLPVKMTNEEEPEESTSEQ
jgi:hypothetical protein